MCPLPEQRRHAGWNLLLAPRTDAIMQDALSEVPGLLLLRGFAPASTLSRPLQAGMTGLSATRISQSRRQPTTKTSTKGLPGENRGRHQLWPRNCPSSGSWPRPPQLPLSAPSPCLRSNSGTEWLESSHGTNAANVQYRVCMDTASTPFFIDIVERPACCKSAAYQLSTKPLPTWLLYSQGVSRTVAPEQNGCDCFFEGTLFLE